MTVVDLRGALDFSANPYPYYAKLRAEGPAHAVRTEDFERAWLIVGYEEARAALADQRFSKDWRTAEIFSATGSDPRTAGALPRPRARPGRRGVRLAARPAAPGSPPSSGALVRWDGAHDRARLRCGPADRKGTS